MALGYGRNLFDIMDARIGAEQANASPAAARDCDPRRPWLACRQSEEAGRTWRMGWARIIATHVNRDASAGGIHGSGPEYAYTSTTFQAGLDLIRQNAITGQQWRGGLFGSAGELSGDVRHLNQGYVGKNVITANAFGGYLSYTAPTGWFVNATALAATMDVKSTSIYGTSLKLDGNSYGASIDGGVPFQIGAAFQLQPEAQLLYQHLNLPSAGDQAARVRFRNTDSLAARAGLRLSTDWTPAGGFAQSIGLWARASVWYEFLGEPKTEFSSLHGFVPFRSSLAGAWADLRAGASVNITPTAMAYVNAGYQIGFDGRNHSYDGRLGLRILW